MANTPSATVAPSTIAAEPGTLLALTAQGAKQGAAFSALRTALAAGARTRGVDLDGNALNLLTAAAAMTIHAAGAHGERPKLIAFGELALVGAASHGVTDLLGMLEEWITPMLVGVEGKDSILSA